MKRSSLVLCGIIALILILPATHAAVFHGADDNGGISYGLEATVEITPKTLSFNSSGTYVTCCITPPEGYTVDDIIVSSIYLDNIPTIPDYVEIIDRHDDGIWDMRVKFDRSAVLDLVSEAEDFVELTVTGSFEDDETFFGVDTVRIYCSYYRDDLTRSLDSLAAIDSGDITDVSLGYQTQGGRPHHYAVIVGISDYKVIGDLSFCDEDANDWYSYLTDLGYDEIIVLGDNTNSYLKYDGLASEYNAKQALLEMVSQAGPRDTIAFISSGHGSGDSRGASLLCMWDITAGENGEDGYFWDYELAAILELAIADQVFVFLDHCFAGGFGEELMSMSNSKNVYFASTCDIMGMGWDSYDYYNGLWTYFFLEFALIDEFDSNPNTAMETAFVYATAYYPYPIPCAHYPQEFDGDPSKPFLLW